MTTTDTITRRYRRDDADRFRYIVAGPAGAIEYHGHCARPIGIEHHAPRPKFDGDEPSPCDVLNGPCYPDGTSAGARDLCVKWLQSGRDDEVIWRELETRYAEMTKGADR